MEQQSRSPFLTLFTILIVTLSVITAPISIWGQADQGGITGIVHDSTGAVVPGAKVTIKDPQNGFTTTVTTDGSGSFTASPLKIGSYTVEAESQGFSPTTQPNVVVNVSSTTTANLQLGVQGAAQQVVVTSAPPALQTEDSSTGQVTSSRTINDTPLNGRNFTFIAQLSAGVAPAEQGARGANKGDFSANGQRSEQNNFILDGVDNNANLVDFLNGASFVIKPPPDALQEFKVQTGDYTAELGHAAGAVLNVATKSGSNSFHGDLWEYFRNDVLNARDYFQTAKPKYRQNQFGATLGGPIVKNKLFFFGDAEANRVIFGQTGIYSVPTLNMRNGDFSQLLNPALNGRGAPVLLYRPGGPGAGTLNCNGQQNVICPANINKTAQNILNAFPKPNLGAAGQTYNNYLYQGSGSDNTTQYDGRMDWNISPKDQTFARYSYTNEPINLTAPLGILDGGGFGGSGRQVTEGRNFTFSETHVFTPSLVNEFRFGYNWIHAAYDPPNNNTNLSPQFGLNGIPFSTGNGGLPYFNVSGFSSFGSAQYEPTSEYENVIQILDNVTKQIRNHSIKFGVNFERLRIQTQQPIDPKGTFNFTGKFSQDPQNTANTGFGGADFLQNNIDNTSIANIFAAYDERWYRSAYLQDNWKATSRLTLNLGVRWEYTTPIKELNGNQANFVPDYATGSATYLLPVAARTNATLTPNFLNALAKNNVAVSYTNNSYLVDPAMVNLAPRVGFSFQLDPNTVIRSGYGIFYGGLESVGYYPNLAQNFPFQYDSNFASSGCAVGNCPTNGQSLDTGFTNALNAGLANFVNLPGFRSYATKTQTPYSQQWNLSVQHSFTNSTTATLAYVGSTSHHLQSNPDPNQPATALAPGANLQAARPFNQFGGSSLISYAGNANYNSLQATLERRLTNGLSFLGAYTYAHALDDAYTLLGGSGQTGSGYRNWRLLGFGYDYGSSYIDVRQRFTLNTQYELPVGRGKRFLDRGGVVNQVAGGWAASLLFRVQSGQPVELYANNNPANNGNAALYKNGNAFNSGGTPPSDGTVSCATNTRTVQTWFNPCSYSNPPQGTTAASYGPPGRTMIYGPGYNRTDLSLFKSFPVYRETNIQFRTDVFNLWNTPAYGQPGNTYGQGFGQITSERFGGNGTAGENPDARVVQFALKYIF